MPTRSTSRFQLGGTTVVVVHSSTMAGPSRRLPALSRAVKLQKRAARVGFDWPSADLVIAKIHEEANEIIEAQKTGEPKQRYYELRGWTLPSEKQ